MSGLTALVSKGPIDRYLTSDDINNSHFKNEVQSKDSFVQAPKLVTTVNPDEASVFTIKILLAMCPVTWFEGGYRDQSVL